jgi:hypothetical protein
LTAAPADELSGSSVSTGSGGSRVKTTMMVTGVGLLALVMTAGTGRGVLGMTLGGAAVLALFAGIAVWIRRTMSHH